MKFEYEGYIFSRPKISREFSYLAIDRQQERNTYTPSYSYRKTVRENAIPASPVQEWASDFEESHSAGLGLFMPTPTSNISDEAAFKAELKCKKKAKRKRGFRL